MQYLSICNVYIAILVIDSVAGQLTLTVKNRNKMSTHEVFLNVKVRNWEVSGHHIWQRKIKLVTYQQPSAFVCGHHHRQSQLLTTAAFLVATGGLCIDGGTDE